MDSMKDIIDILLEKRRLEKNYDYLSLENSKEHILGLKCLNSDFEEEYYLLVDFSSTSDDEWYDLYYSFEKSLEEIDDMFPIAVMGFKDRKQEKEVYNKLFKETKKAADKRKLKTTFESKISIYVDISKLIKLEYEDDINYLENHVIVNGNNLDGNVYNISLYEINKLFNVAGNDLFVKNVRSGIPRNSTANKLKTCFKSYIQVYLHNELINRVPKEKLDVADLYNIKEDMLIENCPDLFWFCHNGITIFSYDKENIIESRNIIRLNPSKVSVINGAQTLTNFFDCLDDMIKEVPSIFEDKVEEKLITLEEIKSILNDSAKKIIVKTIIINGPEKYVSPITYGLNTQIPVKNEDIISNSEDIKEINKYLKYGQIEILKPGQLSTYKYSCEVLDYIKKYEMCIEKPGTSKNFSKKDLEETVKESRKNIKDDKYNIIKKLILLFDLDEWWKHSKSERESIINIADEGELNLLKYGKNYFFSYYLKEEQNSAFDDDFLEFFSNFIYDMKIISNKNNIPLNDATFKKNDLFDIYKTFKEDKKDISNKLIEKTDSNGLTKNSLNELKKYLNDVLKKSDNKFVHKMNSDVLKYFENKDIDIRYFRIIKTDNKKCREAFPFSSSVFSDIYMMNEDLSDDKYKKYEDSSFCNQVKSDFPLFVLDYEEDVIKKIFFNNNFSFRKYSNQAEFVYNKTIDAFRKGDESLFPKMGDDAGFHVRPKAKNADDTFEFTNGNQITKRTFWANKKLINTILENIDDGSNEWIVSD